MLAKNLEKLMEARRLTLARLASLSKTPKTNLHSWLSGQKAVNLDQLKRVADVLQVSVAKLAYGQEDANADKAEEVLSDLFAGDIRVVIQRINRIPKKL